MIHKAKKSLGQNFLKSEIALRKIIEAGEIREDDTILEIGPGKGALTKKLLEKAGIVIAVEKDRELARFLKIKFGKEIAEGKLILIEKDILKIDPLLISPFARDEKSSYKIIANIPYNITGAILKKFLTEKYQPESMVLLVQHEVAQRIIARDGKESLLSISVKAYGEPKMIMKVSARYFSPAPKVDSAIISIKNISRKNFSPLFNSPHLSPLLVKEREKFEARFWQILRAGFAHKRKKLAGNLKPLLEKNTSEILRKAGVKENARAENISLKQWIIIITVSRKNLPPE